MTAASEPLARYCLVTVGATVGFQSLVETTLESEFWHFLSINGFTHLRIQCGPDEAWANALVNERKGQAPDGLDIVVFDKRSNLMKEEMTLCKPKNGSRAAGLVISHAGTGTILDAWKLGVPLIVVPNAKLLDDHQTEMAKHLAHEGYATMSSTKLNDLQEAIRKSWLLSEDNKSRWPAHQVATQPSANISLWDIAPAGAVREEDARMIHD